MGSWCLELRKWGSRHGELDIEFWVNEVDIAWALEIEKNGDGEVETWGDFSSSPREGRGVIAEPSVFRENLQSASREEAHFNDPIEHIASETAAAALDPDGDLAFTIAAYKVEYNDLTC